MPNIIEKIFSKTISQLKSIAPYKVDLAVILGSGLGDFSISLIPDVSLLVTDLLDYPPSTVQSHTGMIHFATFEGLKIILFEGRVHFYEGYSINQCLLPVELAAQCGAKEIVITNAAGGINTNFAPGDLMLASGYNAFSIKKELAPILGAGKFERRNLLTSLSEFPIYEAVKDAAKISNVQLKEGVYFYTKGPSYETPAEIRYMRNFGGDAVGMSSVHEAIYAIHKGMKPVLISCITNFAAGISSNRLAHSEVTETANLVKSKFELLLKNTFKNIISQN